MLTREIVLQIESFPSSGLCTRNVSRALIERPYSREPQAVGAVYDRPGFFVQSRYWPNLSANVISVSTQRGPLSSRTGVNFHCVTAPRTAVFTSGLPSVIPLTV